MEANESWFAATKSGPPETVVPQPVDLRDWFAGQALVGILAREANAFVTASKSPETAAQAYRLSDAMLAARAQTEEKS